MTFIDFFAGIGGFRRGMELAGHKCLGFCEYDKFAVQSYRAIHNTEGEWYAKDIRKVRANDIPGADCWCAGFPCQDVSISGKQLGFKGKRSSLFFTVTGLIADLEKENRPKLLFFENVKNLLSVNRGFDFARLLVELDKIGYDAEWAVLNTADVLPQNRERVFIIGRLRGGRIGQVFPVAASGGENNVLQRFTTGTITTRTGQAASVGTYVAENKFNAQEMIYQKPRGNNVGGLHNIAPTLTSNAYEQNNLVVKQCTNIVAEKGFKNPQRGRVYDPSGISPTLTCMGGGGLEPKIAIPCLTPDRVKKRQNGRRFKNDGDPSFTLTAQDRQGVAIGGIYTQVSAEFQRGIMQDRSRTLKSDKHDAGVVIINGSECLIRKLTPLEYWRLQGWEDEDFFRAFFLDKKLAHKFNAVYRRHRNNPARLMEWAFRHQKTSDSQLYKQAGNGVTTLVVKAIAERLEDTYADI